MTHHCYDLEVTPNCFTATFLDIATNKQLIKDYCIADIKNDAIEMARLKALMNVIVFEISERRNDIHLLKLFLQDKKFLVGYNNHKYDDWVIAHILAYYEKYKKATFKDITTILYKLSNDIIRVENYVEINLRNDDYIRLAKSTFESIDLMRLHYLDKYFISLKQVSIKIKWYNILDYSPPAPTREDCVVYYGHDNVELVKKLNHFERFTTKGEIANLLYYNLNDVLITFTLLLGWS